jgi:hypothetical protein
MPAADRFQHRTVRTSGSAGTCSDTQFVVALNSWGTIGRPHEFRAATNADLVSIQFPHVTFEIDSILQILAQGSGVLTGRVWAAGKKRAATRNGRSERLHMVSGI